MTIGKGLPNYADYLTPLHSKSPKFINKFGLSECSRIKLILCGNFVCGNFVFLPTNDCLRGEDVCLTHDKIRALNK